VLLAVILLSVFLVHSFFISPTQNRPFYVGVEYAYADDTAYGILEEEHFEALKKFWTTLHSDPDSFGSNEP